ncbi:unnamed protein product (mitochondrion) [Plasmodiophora brassicae]|uniref:RING-type domain-containing protein n=1 Tax=Plasmodiophora brassicae TaxID=37360 RepID=A0A0G4IKP5_PLABS|nr:hypothetical protein PBRA_004383 [Plasmodiophora brassicae]SPR00527.1 unnamed protein product [Plasmodiophora brassicae]
MSRGLVAADLECSICLRLLFDPVTLTCGHTLCRGCLVRAMDEKRQCPFCRHPCQANAVAHASTTVLTGLLEKYFAEETAARATEANVERRDYRRRLPLFLSQTVDFPVRDVTYFMFEPRYRRLVSDCLAGNRQFVAVADVDGNDLGCIISITEVQQTLDGRCLVFGRGTQAVRLSNFEEVDMGFGLVTAAITPVDDEPSSAADSVDLFDQCRTAVTDLLRLDSSGIFRRRGLRDGISAAPDDPSSFSYWAAGMVDTPLTTQLEILGESNVRRRLQLARDALRDSIRRINQKRKNSSLIFLAIIGFTIAYSLKAHLTGK